MTQSIGGFFSGGGGGRGILWPKEPPAKVTGTITAVIPPEEILDLKDKTPTGKYQVRIGLKTDLRNFAMVTPPDDPAETDDGSRTLYVKSFMRGAVGDALRKAGVSEPEVGGKLTVIFHHTEPSAGPGLSPSKHFEAEYTPPTSTFFSGDVPGKPASSASTSNGEPERPAAFDAAAWAGLSPEAKKSVAATMGALPGARLKNDDEPPF